MNSEIAQEWKADQGAFQDFYNANASLHQGHPLTRNVPQNDSQLCLFLDLQWKTHENTTDTVESRFGVHFRFPTCVDFPGEEKGIHFCMRRFEIDESSLSLSHCECGFVGPLLRCEDPKGHGHLLSEDCICTSLCGVVFRTFTLEITVFRACVCGVWCVCSECIGRKILVANVVGLRARGRMTNLDSGVRSWVHSHTVTCKILGCVKDAAVLDFPEATRTKRGPFRWTTVSPEETCVSRDGPAVLPTGTLLKTPTILVNNFFMYQNDQSIA